MTTLENLYAAIMADKEADLPRLMYADLCEELGDLERAAFIRNSIKRWHQCRKMPKPPKGKNKEWLGMLGRLIDKDIDVTVEISWRRGFVGEVSMYESLVKKYLPTLVEYYPIEYVTLAGRKPSENSRANTFSWVMARFGLTDSGMYRPWFERLAPREQVEQEWSKSQNYWYAYYDTVQEAKDDLSRAILLWAHEEASKQKEKANDQP